MRTVNYIENLIQDTRFGLRMLAKNPGLTALAVFALAVGIAVNTAVFTAFNAAALRPIQATDPGRIVAVYRSAVGEENVGAFSYPDYLYYRERNRSFEGLFAASGTDVSMSALASASGRNEPPGGITALLGIRFFEQLGARLNWAERLWSRRITSRRSASIPRWGAASPPRNLLPS